ncbi:MAG: type IV secretion system protein [Neisseriaceae bacterium]|nr:type IV secretion system protein [Neisseriaceae bacterium]
MAFGKKKNPQQNNENQSSYNAAKNFIQAAQNFEKSEIERIKKINKIYLGFAIAGLSVAALSAVAVMLLTPLKSVEPFVVRVDNNTGLTDVVSTLKQKTVSNDEVLNKYWLANYVRNRESYSWETIQTSYDTTMLLSSKEEQSRFGAIYQGEAAPHKILGKNFRVAVKIRNIAFVGDTAQVRFSKNTAGVIPSQDGDKRLDKVDNYIATITFDYLNKPTKEEDRLINPLGFQVTNYRIDPEALP